MNQALIFAGGSGTRMNSRARPKQFLQFYGKELIIHTLENFQNHPEIDNIVVVCIEDWILHLEKLLAKGYRPCGGEVQFVVAWKGETASKI